jgi:MFS family permease
MEPLNMTMREYFLYAALIGAGLGALFGLIPLILGLRRDKRRLGLYGFVASIVGGAIAPLLSVVIVVIFSWVIVKKKTGPEPPAETAEVRDEPPSP